VPYHDTMHPVFWKEGAYGHVNAVKVAKLIAPALAGHLALIMQGIGLQYTSASVNQMVSGSCIIFTAMLSVAVLKRRLTPMHITGVVLSMLGVGIVSVSSLLPLDEPSPCDKPQPMWLTVLGIVITLLSQVVQAVQLVLEELMLRDLHLHPFQVLGYEGIIGMVWMALLAAPILFFVPGTDVGSMENTVDTLMMLWSNPALATSTVVYWFTVLGTNMYGVLVSATIGSVFRSVLLTTRTALVWLVDLALFYTGLGGGAVGESLNKWSGFEALGFAFLLAGTLVYARGSQNVEKALEKAIVEAVEASLATGENVVTRFSPLHSPPSEVVSGTSPRWPGTILVRQVTGLGTLLQVDTEPPNSSMGSGIGWDPQDSEIRRHKVVLESLDSNMHVGSSTYSNPFFPRLPLGQGQEVTDIMGTSLEVPSMSFISPHLSPPGSPPRSAAGTSPRALRTAVQVRRDSQPQSPTMDGTTMLLNSVRVSLSLNRAANALSSQEAETSEETDDVGPTTIMQAAGQQRLQQAGVTAPASSDLRSATGVTRSEEASGCGFHMDEN